MNRSVNKKIHKIIDLCIDAKNYGHDCFFDYAAHVNRFKVKTYRNGWGRSTDPDWEKEIKFFSNNDNYPELDLIIEHLENLISQTDKDWEEHSLKDYRDQFELVKHCKNESVKDDRLRDIMSFMERKFQIPYLNEETYNKEHPDVINLYREISNERSFIKN